MKEVKRTSEYRIFQKKSGRYAVKAKNQQWLHGDEKEQVLLGEQLITRLRPKAPAAAEESAAAES
jgi:hypothetical protein